MITGPSARAAGAVLMAGMAVMGITAVHAQSHVLVGYCTGLKNMAAAKKAGFDYVELSTTEIASLPDADFEHAAQELTSLALATPAANLFLPATLKVTGP